MGAAIRGWGMKGNRSVSETKVWKAQGETLAAMAAQELLTPLTPILGYAELLLEQRAGPLTQMQQDYLQSIHNNASRLASAARQLIAIIEELPDSASCLRPAEETGS